MSETLNKNLVPDGRFVENLEWQLASEYRRTRLSRPARGRIAVPRGMAAVVLAVAFLTTGVTVIKASEMIKDSWRKKIEIARAETDVRLAESRLAVLQAEAAQTGRQVKIGLVGIDEGKTTALQAAEAELGVKRSRVSLDEVKATGEPARDELFAPRAGGRDFVLERLQLDLEKTELGMKMVAVRADRLKNLWAVGMAAETEMADSRMATAVAAAKVEEIRGRIELRKSFLDGKAGAAEVEIRGRLAEASKSLKAAQSKVEALQVKMERLTTMEGLGLVSATEAARLKSELESAQAEMRLAAVEKDALEKAR
ncbi:MAG: hypothetical protein NTZ26_01670 [Candidatus Aminicenantes bacterium]|nr:hypothetical protein [Candidatus Aminicenantes bacterium]